MTIISHCIIPLLKNGVVHADQLDESVQLQVLLCGVVLIESRERAD